MSKKAMTLALALELEQRITDYLSGGGLFNPELADHVAVRDLLIDCRKALAEQPAQQEPVATNKVYVTREQLAEIYPPASKPWVGLTDEEKSDLWCESTGRDCVNEDTHVFADAIEAKLREKNNG